MPPGEARRSAAAALGGASASGHPQASCVHCVDELETFN